MTESEKQRLQSDYIWYQKMIEIYTQNKERMFKNEKVFQNHIDEILDEMLEIRKLLNEED